MPLVFGVYAGLGRMLFGAEPPASAVALGDLMRSQWASFAAADPAWLTAASDAVNPADHQDRWGPAGRTGVSFSPVVDGEVLPAAPWQALAAGAGRGVDLVAGHNRDEYRLFTALNGQRGKITEEVASDTLRGLAGGQAGEAAYREAYPDADAEMLFELVNSDWLFRMPTLHLAQAHAAAGGQTFLYQVSLEAPEGASAPATPSTCRWSSACTPVSDGCCSAPSRPPARWRSAT